jgi:prefoldin subunit 5
MSAKIKVEGHEHLVRDVNSGAIVNTNVTEYQLYMKRVRSREQQGDQIRSAVKEINNLKAELREIKGLIKELVNGS